MPEYLFICQQNIIRSRYAIAYFSELLKKRNLEGSVMSAGLSVLSKNRITKEMCNNVDVIFVMEEYMKDHLINKYRIDEGKIVVLDIPNAYFFNRKFKKVVLEFFLIGKNKEEKKRIMNMPEINQKLDLLNILKERELERYIVT